jgi:hypothetical protein
MANYTVRMLTFDRRNVTVELSAVDVLQAATAAVHYFFTLREHVDGASAIVVERNGSEFAVFKPRDILIRMRRGGTGSESAAIPPDERHADSNEGYQPHPEAS